MLSSHQSISSFLFFKKEKKMSIAIAFSSLFPLQQQDTIGEPESVHQKWKNWKMNLEIYIKASDVSNAEQKKAILLLSGEEGLLGIWKNFTE